MSENEENNHSHYCVWCGKDTVDDCLVCNGCSELHTLKESREKLVEEMETRHKAYCKNLLDGEEKIRSYLIRLLHESIKLYSEIVPKIKKEDYSLYGIDDLWALTVKLNELSSGRVLAMGDFYSFEY